MAMHKQMLPLAIASILASCAGSDTGPKPMTSADVSVSGQAQSCFAPIPGHPTSAEQRAFVAEISRLATAAEQDHGVPAAAIAAMAIQESGYGWTTLAQHTNDILAWKYTTASAAGGRDFWVLNCGTSKDRYIVFADRSQAVDFVAQQLATSSNYMAATKRYRQDRTQDVAVVEAVNRWLDDIAAPYSTQPDAYRTAIKRIMNDPFAPSDRQSADQNLYRLSESVQTVRSTEAVAH